MRRFALFGVVGIAGLALLFAQSGRLTPTIQHGEGAPSGSCAYIDLYVDSATGDLYNGVDSGRTVGCVWQKKANADDVGEGGGTPGGADTEIQLNDGGEFGGDAGFTYNKTTNIASLAGGLTPGGDGCFGFVCRKTVTLTDAEIKALGSVPKVIVPAAGEGTILMPVGAVLLAESATLYETLAATDDAHDLALTVNGVAVTHWMSSNLTFSAIGGRWTKMYENDAIDENGLPDSGGNFLENEPIELWNWSGVDYTAGNAANTLTVVCYYTVIEAP